MLKRGKSMFKWLRWMPESKFTPDETKRIRTKSSDRAGPRTASDPIEGLARILGEPHANDIQPDI
jgi:hypothetical protein